MNVNGKIVVLRAAVEADRKRIYGWLVQSDLTSSMMGPPNYPDHPIPTWDEFCQDYSNSFFNTSGDGKGRNYIIMINNQEIGTVGYDLLDEQNDRVVLDIWMKSEKHCGHGYGADALNTLCYYIRDKFAINHFLISPSYRNRRAINAYKKAGFEYIKKLDKAAQIKEFGVSEYDDNILMVKTYCFKNSVGSGKINIK